MAEQQQERSDNSGYEGNVQTQDKVGTAEQNCSRLETSLCDDPISEPSFIPADLYKSISPSLSEEMRIEKLMAASANLAVERLQKTCVTLPHGDLKMLQTQAELLKKACAPVREAEHDEGKSKSKPNIENSLELYRRSINRLKTESALWDSLLEKHVSIAEKLQTFTKTRTPLPLDTSLVAQSSQSKLIRSKPDYHNILSRQEKTLHTVELVLDTRCKLFRELMSFQEQYELLVKETSTKLAAEAGLMDPSSFRPLEGPVVNRTEYLNTA